MVDQDTIQQSLRDYVKTLWNETQDQQVLKDG